MINGPETQRLLRVQIVVRFSRQRGKRLALSKVPSRLREQFPVNTLACF